MIWIANYFRNSLKRQFILALALLVISIQLIFALFNLREVRSALTRFLNDNNEVAIGMLTEMIEIPLGEFNIPEVARLIKQLNQRSSIVYARITDREGSPISETGDFRDKNIVVLKRDVFSKARNGEKIGSVEVGFSNRTVQNLLSYQFNFFFGIAVLLGLAITLTISVLFDVLVLKPIRNLNRFALEKGDASYLKLNAGNDEFGTLSRALMSLSEEVKNHENHLLVEVHKRTRELQKSKDILAETIDELHRAQEQLIMNSNLAAVGRLSASIAHEIANPLTVLKASADQLSHMERVETPEQIETYFKKIRMIQRMTLRISAIINGIRAISRSTKEKDFKKVSLIALVSEALELAQLKFRGTSVKLESSEVPDVEIECNSVQVSQVIINLLGNAYDAVSPSASAGAAWVKLDTIVENKILKILVTDSGLGIPEEIAKKLMEPFFTTKEVGAGTGLGLSISLSIAKDHGGSFELDRSCPNTRFVFMIPLTQSHPHT